jgi:hypothetical protein
VFSLFLSLFRHLRLFDFCRRRNEKLDQFDTEAGYLYNWLGCIDDSWDTTIRRGDRAEPMRTKWTEKSRKRERAKISWFTSGGPIILLMYVAPISFGKKRGESLLFGKEKSMRWWRILGIYICNNNSNRQANERCTQTAANNCGGNKSTRITNQSFDLYLSPTLFVCVAPLCCCCWCSQSRVCLD